MKANFHTHTTRCKHASGADEEYVVAALEAGFEELGFADHAPWPFPGGFVGGARMAVDQLPGYIDSITHLQDAYADRIRIRLGLESEYYPCYHDHTLRMRDMGIQYFILGQHNIEPENVCPYAAGDCEADDRVLRYAEAVVTGIRTGLFAYVAHPDLYMGHRQKPEQFNRYCERAADMICQAAKEQGMPLEYNLLGLYDALSGHSRGYPSPAFWQYARKYDNDVILGVDAHAPDHLLRHNVWQTAVQQVTDLGYRLVDSPVFPE